IVGRPGVVHQDVERPEVRDDRIDRRGDLRDVRHVEGIKARGPSERLDLADGFPARRRLLRAIEDCDGSAGFRQADRYAAPDPLSRAGDQRDLTVEAEAVRHLAPGLSASGLISSCAGNARAIALYFAATSISDWN